MDPTLDDLARMLGGLRPRPRPEFVSGLEQELKRSLDRRRPHLPRLPRMPRLLAVAGVASAFAAVLLTLSIAGALPLHLGSAREAAADRQCATVTEWQLVRRPTVETAPNGRIRVVDTTVLVPRHVIRCH